MRPENFLRFFGGRVSIRKAINRTVQRYSILYTRRVVKFLFPFYKITDQVAGKYLRVVEGKICMGQVVDGSVR